MAFLLHVSTGTVSRQVNEYKLYKDGGELMFEANFGKEEYLYLSVKLVFRK